ncbi:MAG: hypothetical protein NTX44_06175 [Ignavibacteriales bacterium]|nr:hypothetical protein [Ignavibacteriales bacterium]
MNILLYYLIFAFAADMYLRYFAKGYQLTLGLNHVYYLIEYIFIMSIITVWQETLRIKRLFQALMLLYILFWIIAKFTFEPLTGLYSVIAGTSQGLLVISAEFTLFVFIRDRIHPVINHYRFWVLLSFVIYYAGTLLIITSRGMLLHYSTEAFFLVTSIDWSLKILFNILFTVGFLCPQTKA